MTKRARASGLSPVTLATNLIGAVGSFVLMLVVGHRNRSALLLLMFALWVTSPFLGLVLAARTSIGRRPLVRAALTGLTMLVALYALGVYGRVAFGPPRPRPAFAFLVVPGVSWVLIVTVVSIARLIGRRRSGRR